MSILYYAYAAFYALAVILTITTVGKPRPPITGVQAAFIAVINAVLVVLLVNAGASVYSEY